MWSVFAALLLGQLAAVATLMAECFFANSVFGNTRRKRRRRRRNMGGCRTCGCTCYRYSYNTKEYNSNRRSYEN